MKQTSTWLPHPIFCAGSIVSAVNKLSPGRFCLFLAVLGISSNRVSPAAGYNGWSYLCPSISLGQWLIVFRGSQLLMNVCVCVLVWQWQDFQSFNDFLHFVGRGGGVWESRRSGHIAIFVFKINCPKRLTME